MKRISYIMTLRTTNVLPFSGKGQSTNGYHQQFSTGPSLVYETRQKLPIWPDATLHGLIMKQSYTDSFPSWSVALHGLILKKSYTDSFSKFPNAVSHRLIIRQPYTGSFSTPDEVLHGLLIRQPYTGSLSARCSFTRTHRQETLHRFSLSKDEVLHGLVIRKPYTGSLSF